MILCKFGSLPGVSIDEYLRLEKPDAICFAGGYRLYRY